jgi:recombinational DNA repair protein RecR
LAPLAQKYDITMSALGRGLSTGTELEYSDSDTIKNALKNRVSS